MKPTTLTFILSILAMVFGLFLLLFIFEQEAINNLNPLDYSENRLVVAVKIIGFLSVGLGTGSLGRAVYRKLRK